MSSLHGAVQGRDPEGSAPHCWDVIAEQQTVAAAWHSYGSILLRRMLQHIQHRPQASDTSLAPSSCSADTEHLALGVLSPPKSERFILGMLQSEQWERNRITA